jgi:hypothetical protein
MDFDAHSKVADAVTGGSGGGSSSTTMHPHFIDGKYVLAANQIELVSRDPALPAPPDKCTVTILASNMLGLDGHIDMRAAQGVRVTAGPPPLPETHSDSTNGVEVMVGEAQNVTIQRGLIEGVDQKMEMTPGNITIDGGAGTIMIQSLTEITLSVAGGACSITLTPAGITIQGPLVQIN